MKTKVILSSPILIEDGTFKRETLTKREAQEWMWDGNPVTIFTNHETVKVLALEPATNRDCVGYDEALIISPNQRLEFGREYTQSEIEAIGVEFRLISKVIK